MATGEFQGEDKPDNVYQQLGSHQDQGVSQQCVRASFGRPFPVMDAQINMEGVQEGVHYHAFAPWLSAKILPITTQTPFKVEFTGFILSFLYILAIMLALSLKYHCFDLTIIQK